MYTGDRGIYFTVVLQELKTNIRDKRFFQIDENIIQALNVNDDSIVSREFAIQETV